MINLVLIHSEWVSYRPRPVALVALESLLHDPERERFQQVLRHAERHGCLHDGQVTGAGDGEDVDGVARPAHSAEQVKTRHVRQEDGQQDEVDAVGSQPLYGFAAGTQVTRDSEPGRPVDVLDERLGGDGLVLDDQDFDHDALPMVRVAVPRAHRDEVSLSAPLQLGANGGSTAPAPSSRVMVASFVISNG